MSNFKVGDTVKIIGDRYGGANSVGDIGVITEAEADSSRVEVGNKGNYGNWSATGDIELVTSDVPIGYTGLPKDMNLKNGDVIEGRAFGYTYKAKLGKVGGVPIEDCQAQYTLVSRADTPQENPWAISGDTEVNYTTHDVAEWRGKPVATRKKLPVVKTVEASVEVAGDFFRLPEKATVVTTDGVPDWSTLKVK